MSPHPAAERVADLLHRQFEEFAASAWCPEPLAAEVHEVLASCGDADPEVWDWSLLLDAAVDLTPADLLGGVVSDLLEAVLTAFRRDVVHPLFQAAIEPLTTRTRYLTQTLLALFVLADAFDVVYPDFDLPSYPGKDYS